MQVEHCKWEAVCNLVQQLFVWIAKISLKLLEQEPIVQNVLKNKGEKKEERIAESVFPQGAKYMAVALLLECFYLPFQ